MNLNTKGRFWGSGQWEGALIVFLLSFSACRESHPPPFTAKVSEALVTNEPLTLSRASDFRVEQAKIFVRGLWGKRPGQFGRDDHASRPGPMSLAVNDRGDLLILDQVNERIVRFSSDGKLESMFAIESKTAEDLAISGPFIWVLDYRTGSPPAYRLLQYSEEGSALQRIDLPVEIQLVTSLDVSGSPRSPDIWLEIAHEKQIQVVSRGRAIRTFDEGRIQFGKADHDSPPRRILLSRSGWDSARLERIYPGNYASRFMELRTPGRLIAIHGVSTDALGCIYFMLTLGDVDGFGGQDSRVFSQRLVRISEEKRTISIQLPGEQATDMFRAYAISKQGVVYVQKSTEEDFSILSWNLAAPGERR